MLDNFTILAFGGIVICAVFLISELLAKWFDWE